MPAFGKENILKGLILKEEKSEVNKQRLFFIYLYLIPLSGQMLMAHNSPSQKKEKERKKERRKPSCQIIHGVMIFKYETVQIN